MPLLADARRHLRSLRVRLLGTLGLSVLLALAGAAVLVRGATESEFERYVGKSRLEFQTAVRQIAPAVGGRVVLANGEGRVVADSGGEWIGWTAAPSAGAARPAASPEPSAQTAPASAALPMEDVRVFLLEGEPARPAKVSTAATAPSKVVKVVGLSDGGSAGMVAVAAVPGAAGDAPADVLVSRPERGAIGPPGIYAPERSFLGAVERALAAGALIGGVAALALGLTVSQRILKPVDALTAAVRRMGAGDLDQRVPVAAADEIGELASAFNAMAGNLARTERLRRTMVTDVAHELRTPLTNLRGYLEAIQDGVALPDPEVIASLHEEALHLSRLVDDLQDLALAEAGQLPLERQPLAVADFVGPVARLVAPRAAAAGVSVEAHLPSGLPAVDADPVRARQIVHNLVGNAVRHTPAGGAVRVAARRAGEDVEVTVADSGEGIPPEHLPHVFERFYRADRSRSRATGGAGIGLAVVRQLVEAHGGRVAVESTPGRGTTMRFTLPIAAPVARATGVTPWEGTALTAEATTGAVTAVSAGEPQPGSVHVWSAGLDPPPARLDVLAGYLSPDERARGDRFHFPRDRRRYLAARGTLREILGAYLHQAPAALAFAYGPQGKPALDPPDAAGLDFNLSHSADLALFALARGRPVGVDVEAHRELADMPGVAARVMTGAELAAFEALPADARPPAFYALWTRKEAYMKAVGAGFSLPPESFAVAGLRAAGWTLRDLAPAPGFAACIAVQGPLAGLCCRPWPGAGGPRDPEPAPEPHPGD
jgi:signal transduction histidine kinase/phosphopantetheinyl transferase